MKKSQYYRGDIVLTNIGGKKNLAVIISNNSLNYNESGYVVLNITTKPEKTLNTHIDIVVNRPGVVVCEKLWNIWKDQAVEFVRECTAEEMNAVDKGLRVALGLCETQTKKNAQTPDPAANSVVMKEFEELRANHEKMKKEFDVLVNEMARVANDNLELAEKNDCLMITKIELENTVEDLRAKNAELMEKSEQRGNAADTTALKAERDLYKSLYEKLLDKLIGA